MWEIKQKLKKSTPTHTHTLNKNKKSANLLKNCPSIYTFFTTLVRIHTLTATPAAAAKKEGVLRAPWQGVVLCSAGWCAVCVLPTHTPLPRAVRSATPLDTLRVPVYLCAGAALLYIICTIESIFLLLYFSASEIKNA